VKPLDFPLLADENVQPPVVTWLRDAGLDVRTVFDENLNARSDVEILARAHEQVGASVGARGYDPTADPR
jgi:predicted nuclease of predicted toxin-antitoxin system